MAESLADGILLAFLEAGGRPLSGQALASRFGVTRAAVWKCVCRLREDGYPVESLAAKGYRLEAGRGELRPAEISARLTTRRFGRELRCLPEVDSTSREAARWAERGAPEGAVVVAREQSAGRGRLGRTWVALPGQSLLMSVLLRPALPPDAVPRLTYVAALSLARALAPWVREEDLEIKWPNDLLLSGRKVAGILLESRMEGARIDHVVVGVGVNVGGAASDFPPDVRELAATLAQHVRPGADVPSVPDVLAAFLAAFEEDCDRFATSGFAALAPEWNHWFRMAGRRIRVSGGARVVEGEVIALDEQGALLVRTGPGSVESVLAGDVALLTTKTTCEREAAA